MVSLVAFVTRLLGSLVDLTVIFVTEVALRDPLAFVAFLVGSGLVTVSVAALGYLVVGAVFREVGVEFPTPGRTRRRG
jgi:hypothetical protein